MNITGSNEVAHPPERVWEALLDPQVLVATIPGCSRLTETGEHAYAMTVTAGVAAIRGTYDGTCVLADLVPHEALTMRLSGAGAPGTVEATVAVGFAATDAGTRVTYDADATVGGVVGGVGQRMLASVSRRMAGEFFAGVAAAIDAPVEPVEPVESVDSGATTFTAPTAPAAASSRADLLTGIGIGAGLVGLGVVLGRWLGRR